MLHLDVIEGMLTDKIRNYIVPGLESYLLGEGRVRMFRSTREQTMDIVPHNHRFNLACYVLQGRAVNRIYQECFETEGKGDLFVKRGIRYLDSPGEYELRGHMEPTLYTFHDQEYRMGQWYTMEHHEFHTIRFSKNAIILFFEGPELTNVSDVLLPYVDGKIIHTLKTEPWMFLKDEPDPLDTLLA